MLLLIIITILPIIICNIMFKTIEIKEIKQEVGRLIKTIRKKRKLTQIEIANSLDVSRNTIQNLEAGKNFTIDTLFKVLKEFDLLDIIHKEILDVKNDIETTKSLY